MSNYIYADNAATTQLDRSAYEAMSPYLLESYGNPSQPYSFSRAANTLIGKTFIAIKTARNTLRILTLNFIHTSAYSDFYRLCL